MKLTIKGFTLPELLIVIAIIGILVMIAIPNFLELRARAKTGRTKSDMRTLSIGLESYRTDNNCFVLCNNFGLCTARYFPDEHSDPQKNYQKRILERLTTPHTYLSQSQMVDSNLPIGRRSSFSNTNVQGTYSDMEDDLNFKLYQYVKYHAMGLDRDILATVDANIPPKPQAYVLSASGPTRAYANLGTLFTSTVSKPTILDQIYDPTNGTMSYGYIFRTGGQVFNEGYYAGNFLSVMNIHGMR